VGSLLLLGVGGASSITPQSFGTDLYAWWDFQSASWLYQDTALTTPVTTNNNPIGGVFDRSGNGRTPTQGTGGSRPLWKDTLYAFPSALLDKIDDSLVFGTPVGVGYEVFIKAQVTRTSFPGPTTDDIMFSAGNNAATSYEFDTYNSSGATGTGSNRFASRNGSNLYFDGATFTSGTAITPGLHTFSSQFTGGGTSNTGYFLGRFNDNAFFGNQALMEVVVIGRNCTAAERVGLHAYLLTSNGS
jgi:hypothetical protein